MRGQYFREISLGCVFLGLLGFLGIFAPAFFELQPLLSRLSAQTPAMVVVVGMSLVMICRQIDISVGAQFGVCAVVAGLVSASGAPLVVVVGASILGGAAMGALNGWLVAGLGLPSIVVTLATMATWQEALRLFQQGKFVNLPVGVQWFGLSQVQGQMVLIGGAVGFVGVAAWALKNLMMGRRIYAVGSDAEAARLAGIDPRRTTMGVFVVLGGLTGLAAVMNVVQSPQVDPLAGSGLEMKVIAAAVVGGVAVSGGRGRLWGVFVGLLLLATVNPALTYLRVESYWEKAIQGLVLIVAVVADRFRRPPKFSA